jgi:hypothetical protein
VGTDLLIGIVGLTLGLAVLFLARPTTDGQARFLRNSSWVVVFPVIPLLFLTIGVAMLIKAIF